MQVPEYEVARQRPREQLAEAEMHRLQRLARRSARRCAVKRLAMIGGCTVVVAALVGVAVAQGLW